MRPVTVTAVGTVPPEKRAHPIVASRSHLQAYPPTQAILTLSGTFTEAGEARMPGKTGTSAGRMVGTPVAYGLETFQDRVEVLRSVHRHLVEGQVRLVTLIGPRGIGKSALAAMAADRILDQPATPGEPPWYGVVNVSTRTAGVSVERIYLDCARLLDGSARQELLKIWTSQQPLSDKLVDLFDKLADQRCLILLDNIEDVLDDAGKWTDPELTSFFDVVCRARRPTPLLITTRIPIDLPLPMRRCEMRIYLDDGLPVMDGVRLLRELDRTGEAGLAAAAPAELESAVQRLHGVPRALELLVGALTTDSLRLPTLELALATFARRGDVLAGLAHEGYQSLDDSSRLVLDALAIFGRPVLSDAVAWVFRPLAPEIDVPLTLAHLASRGRMVKVDRRTKEFALHPMDTDLIRAELTEEGFFGSRSLNRRAADWYARQTKPRSEWATVDDVLPNRHEFDHRIRAGDFDTAATVLDEFAEFLLWRGSVTPLIAMHDQLAGRLTDSQVQLSYLSSYGITKLIAGPVPEAITLLTRAVRLAEELNDRPHLQRSLYALGDAYRLTRQLDAAIEPLTRALILADELSDHENAFRSMLSLSLAHSYRGDVTTALLVAEELRSRADQLDHDLGRAQSADATACAKILDQCWEEAIAAAELAISCYQRAGVNEALGYTYNTVGLAKLALSRYAEAQEAFRAGCSSGENAESPRAAGYCWYNLTWSHLYLGEYTEAFDTAGGAVRLLRACGGADGEVANALSEAARALLEGDRRTAQSQLLAAARLSIGNPDLAHSDWLINHSRHLGGRGEVVEDSPTGPSMVNRSNGE